jgi:cytochrome c-type biogenesis protein CcmE
VPDMDVEVTAIGTMNASGHFAAEQIMAKCPSKYDMKQRAQGGEQAPHAPLPGAAAPAY